MGLSSLPAPSEGVLCILLMNTALSFSLFKGLLRAILHILRIGISTPPATPPPPQSTPAAATAQSQPATSATRPKRSSTCVTELFRSRVPTVRFGEVEWNDLDHDGCSVCLTEFELESEINHVACGHVFHRVCLEKWLDVNRWSITCPLCRTPLMVTMPEEHPSYSFGYTFDDEEEEEDY